MMQRTLSIPEIGLIAITRGALGIGIGLLLSPRLGRDASKAAGIALTVVGALTTVPLVMHVLGTERSTDNRRLSAA